MSPLCLLFKIFLYPEICVPVVALELGRAITKGAGYKGATQAYLFINSLNLRKIFMLVTLEWVGFNFDYLKLLLFYLKTYYFLFTKEKKSDEIEIERNYFLYLFTCYKISHIKNRKENTTKIGYRT